MADDILESINVLGESLQECSQDPVTGFFRNGCCDTSWQDVGCHTVCVVMTEEFLDYSKQAGNDLSTPRPEMGFEGLSHGDRWCLCATRFVQAYEDGKAPKVVLAATHAMALRYVSISCLISHAIDVH
ncbi:MAG: DUF2237 domain-containing protein [Rhodobacteraceae bacterium]|nr:DUF2237 domain-containing protein [Paracoccaceae bacterium]